MVIIGLILLIWLLIGVLRHYGDIRMCNVIVSFVLVLAVAGSSPRSNEELPARRWLQKAASESKHIDNPKIN